MPVYKKVNKDFFKKWTPEMAYVLGFFAADGYITLNKRGGGFWCLDIAEKTHLQKIRKIIQSKHKISIRKRSGGKYTNYRLQIGSIEMCNDLENLGYFKNKTNNLSLPKVPDRYLSDFVRGYFDGDGNVWAGLVHKGRNIQTFSIQTVFTSCSNKFLEALRLRLEAAGIEKGRLRKEKGGYYRLVYSVLNSLKLYNFMYNGLVSHSMYLFRKKVVFDRYIKLRL